MPRQAVVPIPELAVAFLDAVENGRRPVLDMCEQFGLTYEQAEKRSWRLRKSGWLPRGWYTQDGWLEQAREMVSERLDLLADREDMAQVRLERRLRLLRAQLAREQAAMTATPVQWRQPRANAAAPRKNESVLDFFG